MANQEIANQTVESPLRDVVQESSHKDINFGFGGAQYRLRESSCTNLQILNMRLNHLLEKCREVDAESEVEDSVANFCGKLAHLIAFDIPDIYQDGESKWCFDWETDSNLGVYCRLESAEKLLVVVDDGSNPVSYTHLTLPTKRIV